MDKNEIKNDLQKIIDICNDGVEGYETAAGKIDDNSMKTLFLRLSQQRKGFIENLKNEALTMGIEFNGNGTAKGFFHRTWLATKSTFSSDKRDKVIEEAMSGEKKALEVYSKVSADPSVPEYLQKILEEQERLIKVAIQQLHGLLAE